MLKVLGKRLAQDSTLNLALRSGKCKEEESGMSGDRIIVVGKKGRSPRETRVWVLSNWVDEDVA